METINESRLLKYFALVVSQVRRALGDFGVLISLMSMTGLAWALKGPYIQVDYSSTLF